MGPALAYIGTFIKAVFVGVAAGTTVSAGYILAINIARVGLLALAAKLTAPKLDLSHTAVTKSLTIRDPIAPQSFVYGEDMLSGPIIFANVAGDENRDLYLLIALTGHEIDSVTKYRIDDEDVALSDLSNAEDGDVTGGKFDGVARVTLRKGTSSQTSITDLTSTFSDLFNAAHTGRGWSHMLWKFSLIEGSEDVFKTQPGNIRAVVRGYGDIYDPRLDTGGAGDDPGNASFQAWTDNPALCLAHFMTNQKFGVREETDRIDWAMVETAADVCDELVAIPTAATQKRYTCNVTFKSNESRGSVRDELLGSMMGRMVFSQGLWKMWAGEAVTADVTLTEANLAGGIQLQASTPSRERYNRVRGKFVDASRDYTAATYVEQRSSTFETEDGSEVREIVADFTSTNNDFEAQRKAIITLKQSRNQRIVVFQGNYSCFRIQPGATIDLTIDEYGFAGEKFFVTEWKLATDGIELTLVEEVDSAWADPDEGDYSVRSATGTLVFGDTGVPPPTAFSGASQDGGFLLQWTNPPANTFAVIEVWASDDNVRGNANIVATVTGNEYLDQISNTRTRWYWIRARNSFGENSTFEPDLTTTTVTGSATGAGSDGLSIVVIDVFQRSATAPATPTVDDGSYNFTTLTVTPPSGWFATQPAGTDPLYVSSGTFSIVGITGTDNDVTWTTPALLIEDGDDGKSVFIGNVFLRKATAPTEPVDNDGSYNFTTNVLVPPADPPSADDWFISVPAGVDPLYVSTGTFEIIGPLGTDNTVDWSAPVVLATDGADGGQGDAGDDGLSVFVGNVFQRSATAPATPTVDDGSYNFTTQTLTPPSGWFVTPPAGSDPLYVSTGSFNIVGQTGTDNDVIWTSPDILVEDGNSVFVGQVFLRKASAPTEPIDDDGSYNFGTNVLDPPSTGGGSADNWFISVPAGSDDLYVSVGTFEIAGTTNTDQTVDWSAPVVLASDGAAGAEGNSVFVGNVFIRASTAPTEPIDDDGSYNFATNVLTPPTTAAVLDAWNSAANSNNDSVPVSAGTNRLLIVVVNHEDNGGNPTGADDVDWGGQAMTLIVFHEGGTSARNGTQIWYLDEVGIAAASGNTLDINGTTGDVPSYGAISFTGINQSTPIRDFTGTNGSDPNTSNLSAETGDILIGSFASTGGNNTSSWDNGLSSPDSTFADDLGNDPSEGAQKHYTGGSTTTLQVGASGGAGTRTGFACISIAPADWSTTVPAGTDPLYVSSGSFEVSDATQTDNTVDWTPPVILAQDGSDGSDGSAGATGDSVFVGNVFLRKATAPTEPVDDSGEYNFTTNVLTPPSIALGSADDWFITVPAGTDPLYVSAGSFEVPGPTGTDTTVDWSAPVILASDGAAGSAGAEGNSVFVGAVYLRKATAPTEPVDDDGQYNFATNVLTPPSTGGGSADNWFVAVPAGTDPLYVSHGSFEVSDATETDITVDWTAPVILASDGAAGGDGDDALAVNYTNNSHAVPVDNLGVETWTGSGGLFFAYEGTTVLTLDQNAQSAAYPSTPGEYRLDITKISGDTLTEPAITGETTTTATIADWASDLTTATVYRISAFILTSDSTQVTVSTDVTLTPSDQGADGGAGTDGDDALAISYTNNSHAVPVDNLGAETWTGSGGLLFVYEGATVLTLEQNAQSTSFPTTPGEYRLDITAISGDTLTEPAITGETTTTATLADWAGNLTTATVYRVTASVFTSESVQITLFTDITLSPSDQGADGSAGGDGDSVFVGNVFLRKASAPTEPIDDDGSYNFTTNVLTPPSTGGGSDDDWFVAVPAGTDDLYVSTGSFSISGATGTDNDVDWTAPVILASDGSAGGDGDSVFVGQVFLRKATAPTEPVDNDGSYNFTTNVLKPPSTSGDITFVGADEAAATAANLAVPIHADTLENDIVFLFAVTSDGDDGGFDAITSWTEILDAAAFLVGGSPGSPPGMSVFWRKMPSSPPATVTIVPTFGSTGLTGQTITMRGQDLTTPIETTTQTDAGNSTNANPPTIGSGSSTDGYSTLIACMIDGTVQATALPSGYTDPSGIGSIETTGGGNGHTSRCAYRTSVIDPGAAEDPAVFTSSTEQWGACTIAIRPAVSADDWSITVPAGTDPLYVSSGSFEISGATGTDDTVDWTAPIVLASDGDDGLSVFVGTVFQRAASAPATPSVDDGSYNFTTNTLTPPSGWSITPPAGSSLLLWVSTGSFSIIGQTGTDNDVVWTAPDLLVQDGNSIIVANVFLRKATAPTEPIDDDGEYNFTTGTLTPPSITGGSAEDWFVDPPAGTDPVYVSSGTFEIIGPTGIDSTVDWSAPVKLVSDGAAGAAGRDGIIVGGVRINVSTFAQAEDDDPGEMYIHGLDNDGVPADVDGALLVNGVVETLPKGIIYTSQTNSQGFLVLDLSGTGFTIPTQSNADVVAAKIITTDGVASWEYDNNAAWVTLTPTDDMWVIGSYEVKSAEDVFQAVLGSAIALSTLIIQAARIEVAQLSAISATIGYLETRATGGSPTTPRLVLSDSDTPLEIYADDDQTLLFSLADVGGELELYLLGDFSAASIDTGQMFSNAGIEDLRGRLGTVAPINATGGLLTIPGARQVALGSVNTRLDDVSPGFIPHGTSDITLTFQFEDTFGGFGSLPTAGKWTIHWEVGIDGAGFTNIAGASFTIEANVIAIVDGEPFDWNHVLNHVKNFVYSPPTPDVDYEFRVNSIKDDGVSNTPGYLSATANEELIGDAAGGMVSGISKNSGANVNAANRSVLNFIEGSNVTLTIADDAGGNEVDITIATSGGGDVSKTGTPVNNQVAIWTDASTIEGDANFTWDGSLLRLLAGDMRLSDNVEMQFGTSNDARIYFNGTDWFFDMVNGADFRVRGGAALDTMIVALDDNAVELYNNSVLEFRTQSHAATTDGSGCQTKDNAGTMRDIGFYGMADLAISASTNVLINHAHKLVRWSSGAAGLDYTFVSGTGIPVHSVGWLTNVSGSSKDLIQGTSVSLIWLNGEGTQTGSRTFANGGWLTWYKRIAGEYYITGTGIA